MKKKIKFHVLGATRPETVKPDQTSFVAVMTSASGHCYQALTSRPYAIDESFELEVDTARDVVAWPATVLLVRKMPKIPTQRLKGVLPR